MIWRVLRAGIYATLGAAGVVAETYSRARKLARALLPRRREEAFTRLRRKAAPVQPQRAQCRCGVVHYRKSTNDCERCRPEA